MIVKERYWSIQCIRDLLVVLEDALEECIAADSGVGGIQDRVNQENYLIF